MTTTIRVNVFGYDAKWKDSQNKKWYEGKFVFQQVEPTPDLFMDEEGNLTLYPWDGAVDVILKWCSPFIRHGSLLYPTKLPDPASHAIWITKNKPGKPKPGDVPPSDDGQIEVVAGPGPDEITIKDANSKVGEYSYCFAVKLTVGTGEFWFVTDPRITNKGSTRLFRQPDSDYGSGSSEAE